VNPTGNRIVDALPRAECTRLLAVFEPVELVLAEVLGEAGSLTRHVHFPTGAFVSLIARVDAHPGFEVGMIGHEGMVGGHVALGQRRAPLKCLVQGGGGSLRADVRAFLALLLQSAALRAALDRYICVQMAQRANAVVCLRYHEIGPRLARWLLMSRDRAGADRFRVTHELLARMLGVRREGITVAAGGLQRRGLIHYRRGALDILDGAGLVAAACSCYAADRRVHDQVMRGSTLGG
jgi:Crp-like helix-turn-helix domain